MQNSQDKISIIVPVYNLEKYVENCLDSILRQTYQNLEVIVVNDGSTDHSLNVINNAAAKDSRIKVISGRNEGVSKARLKGIRLATGDWIGFVDGDDYIEPDMYEHLIDNARKYSADISHCGYQMIFPKGHIDYYYNTKEIRLQNNKEGIKDLLEGTRIEPGLCNKLFRRSLFENVLSHQDTLRDIRVNEDLLMNYWLFKASNTSIFEDICPYHYLLRDSSGSRSDTPNRVNDPLKVTDIIRTDLKNNTILYPAAYSRFLRNLIVVSSMTQWKKNSANARRLLKNEIRNRAIPSQVSGKLRGMAVCEAYFPHVYKQIRKYYDHAKGNDKKYDLDK